MTHEEILSMLGDYVDYLIANSSAEAPMWNIEKVRSGKPNKWNYIDGCMITACLSLYKTTGDEKYLEFSKEFIDYFVQPDGSIKTYDPKEYNLDNVNQGKNLFILYDIYGDEKYRKAIDTIRSQLLTQPRTKEGNFWHKRHLSVAGVAGRHPYGAALLHGVRDPLQQDGGLHRQLQAVHEHQKAYAGRKRPACTTTATTRAARCTGQTLRPAAAPTSGCAPWAGSLWQWWTCWSAWTSNCTTSIAASWPCSSRP